MPHINFEGNEMRPADLVVRCMIRREGEWYVAVCIDLTLAAQGKTLHEAKRRLHAQIEDYVHQAFTVDRKHAGVLLTRKAPLADLLRFQWLVIASKAKRALERCFYRETLPMRLAGA